MVVDPEGHTHIAASDYTSVYYLTDASGSWARTPLSQAPAGGADIEPVIAIAPDGTLAVAFTRWSIWSGCADCPSLGEIEGVYFASDAGDSWSEPRQVPGFGQHPALAAWNDSWSVIQAQHDGLFWMRKDGVEWPGRKIGDEDASDAQIKVDADGVAHVLFDTPDNLVHVTRNGKIEDAPVPGTSGAEQPRLALDGTGAIELVYTGGVGQVLRRALEGAEWSDAQQLDVGGTDSFDVDAADNLHFTYLRRDGATGAADVVYSSIEAGRSNTVELGAITFASEQPAGAVTMDVDDQGRPHVVYATDTVGAAGTFITVGPAL
jgi:hypothetical protein